MKGGNYKIVYLSPFAKAQRQAEISEVQAFMADVHSIGAIIPSAYDKVDEDKLVDYLHRTRGITPEIMREDEKIEVQRRQRAEMMQMQQALAVGQAGADIAKTGAEAQATGVA